LNPIRICAAALFTLALIAAPLLPSSSRAGLTAETPTTEAATTEPSTRPSFTADQHDALVAAEGSDVTVTGTVSQIRDLSPRVLKIGFKGLDRDGFSGIVFNDSAPAVHDYFDNGDGKDIVGATVAISGKITLFRGNPEIIINDKKQVVVIAPATQPAATQP
jgi:DNA/RNA endonuclease YhcR with UshA esterase domain